MNEDKNEALDNLINSIKEKMDTNKESSTTNNDNNMDFSNILNNLNSNNTKNEEKSNNSGFDISTFLKLQKVLSAVQKDNPKKDLLLSLKPFLRKTRQDKMNDYINMLNVLSILDALKNKGSD